MSRSTATKSRAEKSASKMAAVAATPVTHDIIPGKFTDHDWTYMLDRDDADDCVSELLEEWYAEVDRIIYNNYIQKQLVPYTVTQAKDAILQIIEWQFLSRDAGVLAEGVQNVPDGWIPDEEPEAAVMDCWAQGAVPKTVTSSRTPYTPTLPSLGDGDGEDNPQNAFSERFSADFSKFNTEEINNISAAVSPANESQTMSPHPNNEDSQLLMEATTSTSQICLDDISGTPRVVSSDIRPKPPTTVPENKFRRQRPVKIASTDAADVTAARQNAAPLLEKSGAVSKPLKSSAAVDHSIKISPRRLPTNMVNTVYSIIDPSSREAEERRGIMRNGRQQTQPSKRTTKIDARTALATRQAVVSLDEQFVDIPSTFHPLLIDTMDLAAGVVIRDGNSRTKKGPKQRTVAETDLLNAAFHRGLQPVRVQHFAQPLKASDLLDNHVPIVRPLVETTPIPPISQMAST